MDTFKVQLQEFFSAGDGADDAPCLDAPNLLEHQKRGIEWMRRRERRGRPHGGVLADDMGLGKTLSVMRLIANDGDDAHKTLIVCPLSLLNHWTAEAKKHNLPLNLRQFHGGDLDESFDDAKAVAITYDTLRAHHKHYKTAGRASGLLARHWHRVVLDEAHVIKNHQTGVHAAACALSADNRWCITGTPIHNRHWDMYAIIHFLRCRPFDNVGVWRMLNRNNDTNRIKSVVNKIVLKRNKAEIALDIPQHDVQDVHVRFDEAEARVYNELKSASQRAYDDAVASADKAGGMQDVLWLLCRLRQVCCHPALTKCAAMFPEHAHIFEPAYESSKCRRALELVQRVLDTPDDKVVLVSQWVEFLQLVAGLLRRRGVPILLYTGQLRVEERTAVENQFNAADSPYRVLLMSIKCGGVGLNLTGGNHIIMLEPHWNPQIELQAQDRIHRMGQKKRTYVYKMIVDEENSIERYMKARQDKKLTFVNKVFDRTALNYEDIKKFFSL
ncbi:global transactivator [Orgyia pseudotsugata multiple nucleopolyhedrovirus]|uniref:Probable global transactivator n=1 Tax=Orgyia pseudotsugata multicapsid polyhedrosis virus TaxID=262177 RepID=GTA_NPVOP|nr:global transactivator [Orgyia pseudotsugata multiple nucleopolyhedrovirus]O10302.1 RecName: Full=Probable global transactivator; AltName: Full=ATP-dependent helicase GTA [Orgyia pseudotsugata multiple nucleopolyhedrovirus]pir/T10316/ global transactivator - Orgyia pseudotsugata nuclear polyhedrosis virus [Orgyia pseudotsugata single capsid nuclopolyhedrovirus]AAC59046.1 global transactivator [Orgyia pseudotsugata multiple nucleopolyhedrovirus]